MPRIVVTERAGEDIRRCVEFLMKDNPRVAARAAEAIELEIGMLETFPNVGRPSGRSLTDRELVIPFGGSGYVALYRHYPTEKIVYIIALRHQKEVGY